jgi:hypothetical protein
MFSYDNRFASDNLKVLRTKKQKFAVHIIVVGTKLNKITVAFCNNYIK